MRKNTIIFIRSGFLIICYSILMTVSPCLADGVNPPNERISEKGGMIIKDGRLSVEYTKVRLGDILDQLKDRDNIWFKGNESLLDEKITVQFADLSLEEGVKRILGFVNYALVYHDDGRLAGVMLFNKSNTHTQEKAIAEARPGLTESSSSKVLQQRNEEDYLKEVPPSSEQSNERPVVQVVQEAVPEIQPVKESDITQIAPVKVQTNISSADIVRSKTTGTLGGSLHMENPMQGK